MRAGFLTRPKCPLCHWEGSELLSEISYDDPRMAQFLQRFYGARLPAGALAGEHYRVVRCSSCGFVYQSRILDEDGMRLLYGEWVDQAASLEKKRRASAALYRRYAGQVQDIARLVKCPPADCRVLDFGMGWGYWSRMAAAHGFDVRGYELSAHRCRHARGLGVEVLAALPEQGPHFDCIHASQVFEHLAEPGQTLETLAGLLTERGLVYLRVPDGRGIAARLRREGWSPALQAVHPLEHINCFTRKTLIAMAQRCGLRPANPPARLNWGSLRAGLKREIADRFLTTHVWFRRRG